MTVKKTLPLVILVGLAVALVMAPPRGAAGLPNHASASGDENPSSKCIPVGGLLMTNINAVNGESNLGPAFGDLAGSVVAQPLTNALGFHHFWVTTTGDTINFKDALLKADPSDFLESGTVVVVRWGHYRSEIEGGTGKFQGATGYLDYFGLADFNAKTLVLRYRGQVCYAH